MKAYILGVEGRYRGHPLESQLKEFGIEYEVIWGLDAGRLSESEILSLCNQRIAQAALGRKLTLGEICCAYGHLKVQCEIATMGEQWSLVLEDDALLLENPLDLLNELPKRNAPAIVQLFKAPNARPFWECASDDHIFKKLAAPTSGTVGYFINLAAADEIMRASAGVPITFVADWPFTWRWRILFYMSSHDVVHEGPTDSILEAERGQVRNRSSNRRGSWAMIQSLKRSVEATLAGAGFRNSFRGIFIEHHILNSFKLKLWLRDSFRKSPLTPPQVHD